MLQSQQEMHNESQEETLSALMDGELEDEEARRALGLIGRNDALASRWSEYCLIGDAMRGCAEECPELGNRIRAAIEREPTVLAPMRRPRPQRPAVWLAAAATLAAVTWTLWGMLPEQEPARMADAQAVPMDRQVMSYVAAHQDYAQAVISTPEMHLTPVVLASMEGGQ